MSETLDPVKLVREFHVMGKQKAPNNLTNISAEVRDLRVRLILEECNETIHAMTGKVTDLIGILDGLCDLIYVSSGAVVAFGYQDPCAMESASYIDHTSISGPNLSRHMTYLALILAHFSCRAADAIEEAYDHTERTSEISVIRTAVCTCLDLNNVCCEIGEILELPLEAAFIEVQNANMSKRLEDGTVFHDEGGKLMKPGGFIPPDIEHVLLTGKITSRNLYTVPPNGWVKPDNWIAINDRTA